jgi:acyl carrier protein
MGDTFTKVQEIVCKRLGLPKHQVQEDTSLIYDLRIRTTSLLQLYQQIEREFNIGISDQAADDFVTVGDIADYLDDHKIR